MSPKLVTPNDKGYGVSSAEIFTVECDQSKPKASLLLAPMYYKLVLMRPSADFGSLENAYQIAEAAPLKHQPRLFAVPLVAVISGNDGVAIWEPSLYLAEVALRSRSLTGDTVRTYGESLLAWLEYLRENEISLERVTEEHVQIYRSRVANEMSRSGRKYSSATANLRVLVPQLFHAWAHRSEICMSPVGSFLTSNVTQNTSWNRRPFRRASGNNTIKAPRVIHRAPVVLSEEAFRRLLILTPMPYRLMLNWCLVTGIRRFEICALRLSDLPSAEEIALSPDGLARIRILRKGSHEREIVAPTKLIEDTNWYVLMDRAKPQHQNESGVFLNRRGRAIARSDLTKRFRTVANSIESKATLHHLRHTFAVNVLEILERKHKEGEPLNSIKTLQILLGHSSVETTEIYLQAMETCSDAIMEAVAYLYGADL